MLLTQNYAPIELSTIILKFQYINNIKTEVQYFLLKLCLPFLLDSWSQTPHGFYLHGGVGSGKTILMDIFYDSIPILEKKRVHFYSFMLQLYSSLNHWNLCCPSDELTFNLTPVESIASELAGEAWLLCFDEMQLADFGSTRLLEGVFRKLLESGIVIVTTSNR